MSLVTLIRWSMCALLLTGGVALPQERLPTAAELAAPAARRFPQPVRVGDLIHRKVIQPLESHRLLGHVAGIVRSKDGTVDAVLDYGGFLGFATHPIAVPIDGIALLGADLVMVGFTPKQLDGFPAYESAGAVPVPPDDMIRVALTGPSH